ncbi:MAG: LysR family transcriptional regulator [Chlamydiales bacterium]|nr:LysR family transcriptional regulator [Chlamydiales bacterium]
MTLSLLYMKYFCDSVRLGGVTAAAKANFVTQSAISQGIAKLEHSLGSSLVARHPNRFRLTPEGEKAFLEMIDILKRAEAFQENFSEENAQEMGPLEFACTFSFGLAVIPRLLKKFREMHPQVKVNFICSGNLDEIKQMLRAGSIDFGIVPVLGAFDFSGFTKQTVYQGSYGLYKSSEVDKKEEKRLGFILSESEDAAVFQHIYQERHGKEPELFLKARSWVVAATLAAEGLGIGYFPDYIASSKQLKLRRCEMDLTLPKYQITAVYPQGMKLRKSSEIFLSLFK